MSLLASLHDEESLELIVGP